MTLPNKHISSRMKQLFEQTQPPDHESPLIPLKSRRISMEEVEQNLGEKSIREQQQKENNIDNMSEYNSNIGYTNSELEEE